MSSSDDTRRASRPNKDADKKSPNYRAQQSPRGAQPLSAVDGDCQPVRPEGPPASAAENHDEANQKCGVGQPQTASKDQREKATG